MFYFFDLMKAWCQRETSDCFDYFLHTQLTRTSSIDSLCSYLFHFILIKYTWYCINIMLIRTTIDAELNYLCNFSTHCILWTILEIRTIYFQRIRRQKISALTVIAAVALVTLHGIDICKILRLIYFIVWKKASTYARDVLRTHAQKHIRMNTILNESSRL